MKSLDNKRPATQKILFAAGLILFLIGFGTLSFFGIRKVCRELHRQKLMKENAVVEISDLKIKAPVLEGTDNAVLSEGAGHFPDTGSIGKGNYCIAAHSSTIYKEYFNSLKKAEPGTEILLYDRDKKKFRYRVSEKFIIEPDETWVLRDQGDDRVTLITCTDDGKQRLVVVGLLCSD
ncbi:MAG: class D sortase [Ruminococcus sp.]|nr:class D sortase [Ruminococcus sp.]